MTLSQKTVAGHLTMKKRKAVSAVSLEYQMMTKTALSSVPGILFFSPGFILPVNNLFFSINTFFTISIVVWISFVLYIHPLISSYLNIWIGSLLPLVVHQHFQFIVSLMPYAHHLHLFHLNLHTELWWPYWGYPVAVVTLSGHNNSNYCQLKLHSLWVPATAFTLQTWQWQCSSTINIF